jgi:hypothetical protein
MNVWADCNKDDGLTCDCCTVCCAAPENCGPGRRRQNEDMTDIAIDTSIEENQNKVVTTSGFLQAQADYQVEGYLEKQKSTIRQ